MESLFRKMSVTRETQAEVDVPTVNVDEGRRTVKLAEKGRLFKLQCLLEERERIFKRLMRRSSEIDNLASLGSIMTLEETLLRFNDM